MDRYNNDWASVGKSVNDAMFKYLTSQPDPYQNALSQAQLENYNLKNSFALQNQERKEKLDNASINARNALASKYASQNQLLQNTLSAPDTIGSIFSQIYAPVQQEQEMQRPDPSMVGPMMGEMVESAPPPEMVNERYQQNLPDLFSNAMRYAGDKPQNLGDIFLAFAANSGATPEQINNAQLGSGMSYQNTQAGQDSGFTLSPGAIRFTGEGEQIASAPFKPSSGGPMIRTNPDGTFEFSAEGGLPQILPGKSLSNTVQGEQYEGAKFANTLDTVEDLAMRDATNFGVQGTVKGLAQDVNALGKGIIDTFGGEQAISEAQQLIINSGVNPSLFDGVFDPNLPALQTASDLMVFQAASALAGQSGRSVSDRDVKFFKQIVGDPRSLTMTQEKFLSKIQQIRQILGMNMDVANRTLGGNVTAPVAPTNGWSAEEEAELRELEAMMSGGE
jgi:hypothetical protein